MFSNPALFAVDVDLSAGFKWIPKRVGKLIIKGLGIATGYDHAGRLKDSGHQHFESPLKRPKSPCQYGNAIGPLP